jgi:hypothetical protein
MNSTQKTWTEALVRTIVVAGSGVLLGFALYESQVFTPTMVAFQFTMSSVSAALVYATMRSTSIRNGLATLLVWFVVLTWAIEEFNPWLLWLNSIYIIGIGVAILTYTHLIRELLFRFGFARIFLAGALLSIANGLIIVVLALITRRYGLQDAEKIWTLVVRNCEFGALIGLAVGCGIEIAEIVMKRLSSLPLWVDGSIAHQ